MTSELRRARDESHTLADDIIAMAEKSTRDEEHIAMLQAALRESQVHKFHHLAVHAAVRLSYNGRVDRRTAEGCAEHST